METDELERWRLESLLDQAQTQLQEDALILNALDTYLTASHLGHPTAGESLMELRRIYSAVMRNRYPNPRP